MDCILENLPIDIITYLLHFDKSFECDKCKTKIYNLNKSYVKCNLVTMWHITCPIFRMKSNTESHLHYFNKIHNEISESSANYDCGEYKYNFTRNKLLCGHLICHKNLIACKKS